MFPFVCQALGAPGSRRIGKVVTLDFDEARCSWCTHCAKLASGQRGYSFIMRDSGGLGCAASSWGFLLDSQLRLPMMYTSVILMMTHWGQVFHGVVAHAVTKHLPRRKHVVIVSFEYRGSSESVTQLPSVTPLARNYGG